MASPFGGGARSPARYTGARDANRVIWAAKAFIQGRADWAFPELADVESQFQALDSASLYDRT